MEILILQRSVSRLCACIVRAIVLASAIASGTAGASAPDNPLEAAVKATYLYKFGDFVGWPQSAFDSPSSAINLCLMGQDPFGDTLDKAVSGQRIGDRAIVVRRLTTIAPNSGCQILFVGGSDERAIATALEAVRGAAVLTVTDDGVPGIVRFVVKDNRVRFDIDDQAASANGLTISSKLLSLAVSVKPRS